MTWIFSDGRQGGGAARRAAGPEAYDGRGRKPYVEVANVLTNASDPPATVTKEEPGSLEPGSSFWRFTALRMPQPRGEP
jgi:hypothetical protein